MQKATIDQISDALNEVKNLLDEYSKYINAVELMRFKKEENKLSLMEYAYNFALENERYLPYYLTFEKFVMDFHFFTDFRSLIDLNSQIQEKLWNMIIKSSDIVRKETMSA